MCGRVGGYECIFSFECLCFVLVGADVCVCIGFIVPLFVAYGCGYLWTKNNGCQLTDDRTAEEVFLCKVSIQLDMQMSC